MVRTAFPFYIRGFMLYGRNNIDQLVVSVVATAEMLATYYVACAFRSYIQMAVEAVRQPMIVRLAELNQQGCTAATGHSSAEPLRGIFVCPDMYRSDCVWLSIIGIVWGYEIPGWISGSCCCMPDHPIGAVFGSVYIQGLFVIGRPLEHFSWIQPDQLQI